MGTFFWQIFQSFCIAGVWIALATYMAERLGSRVGGAIANLPSTILVSLVYVALVRSPEYAAQAALAAPLGMAINTIFLFVFVLLLRYHLIIAIAVSMLVWSVLAYTSSLVTLPHIFITSGIYLAVMILSFLLLERVFKIPSVDKRKAPFKGWVILVRALFAGGVVGTTVLISTFANSFWTGIFSTFPAVMLSSMVILTLSQGAGFARAIGKTMILASVNIIVFAGGVHWLYPTIGIFWGTVIAFVLAALFIVFIRPWLMRMR